MSTGEEWALLAGIVVLSFAVETAAGFGSMVVALTLGTLWFSLGNMLGILVPLNLCLSLFLVIRERRHLDWKLLMTRIFPRMGAGLLAGALFVRWLGQEPLWLKAVFAALVMGLAVLELASGKGGRVWRPGSRAQAALLTAGGVVHGMFGTGGPLAVAAVRAQLEGKSQLRASLSALWLVLNSLLLLRLADEAVVSVASLRQSAGLLAPMLGGIVLGDRLHGLLSEQKFRTSVAWLLLLFGAILFSSTLGQLSS